MADGFDDYDMGYTPARLVSRPLSDIFHRPWDIKGGGKASGAKPKPDAEHHNGPGRDRLFCNLSDLIGDCAEEHDCDECSRKRGCDYWWKRVVNRSSIHKLRPGEYESLRAEFEERIRPKDGNSDYSVS